MGLPRLETCCFCLDLRTGNIVLGSINAMFSLILTVVMIVIAASVEDVKLNETEVHTEDEEQISKHAAMTGLYAMSIILVLMFLAKFLFDLLFIYGVCTNRAGIIKAYCIMWIVFFLLSMFTFFLNAPHFSISTICTESFYIGLNVYAVLLSYSLLKQLNEREEI